jgi:hypothetical protein
MENEEFNGWKPFTPEELAELTPGESVVTLTIEWRNGKRLYHYHEGNFRSYSPSRGIVSLDLTDTQNTTFLSLATDYCETSVGRCTIPEHFELHGDFSDDE